MDGLLSRWKDGAAEDAILAFVDRVSRYSESSNPSTHTPGAAMWRLATGRHPGTQPREQPRVPDENPSVAMNSRSAEDSDKILRIRGSCDLVVSLVSATSSTIGCASSYISSASFNSSGAIFATEAG
jgi:hypothetical protein